MNTCYKKARKLNRLDCLIEGDGLVTEVFIGEIGKPLVLPAAIDANETDESRLMRALATRLDPASTDSIFKVEIFEGIIPVASPNFRTNPVSKRRTVTSTDYKISWTDWDDSQEFWDWIQEMTGSTPSDTQPLPFLFWAKQGNNLIGALHGYNGSFTALPSVENGAETPGRTACEISFNIKGMVYDRLKLS